MIADSISNWRKYGFGPAFTKAFKFIESLRADTPPGRIVIDGDAMYASVFEYTTKAEPPTFLEVHRKYVDIQFTLSGVEMLGWATNRDFKVKTPYDAAKDCEFLDLPGKPLSLLEIDPQSFAIFLPDDAHMGGLAASKGAMAIRKVVVKMAASSI